MDFFPEEQEEKQIFPKQKFKHKKFKFSAPSLFKGFLVFVLVGILSFQPLATLAYTSPELKQITLEQKYRSVQNFSWGVLAINTDKSVYLAGQTARLSMAVLDNRGEMDCEAELSLSIKNIQTGETEKLETKDGSIMVNPECIIKNKTFRPDFEAAFIFKKAGVYELGLTAGTKRGEKSLYEHVSVVESQAFEITRQAPTRVYPKAVSDVKIQIKAGQDFNGEFYEPVSNQFKIVGQPENLLGKYLSELKALVGIESTKQKPHVENIGGQQVIVFPLNLKKGDATVLTYSFDAPDVSPEFYIIGPGSLISSAYEYQEPRAWQIANDAVAVKSGNFVKKTSTGAQSITGLGFQPKAIIFSWTAQISDNSILNTGAAASNSKNTSIGMGIASQTGTVTSTRAIGLCDDSTGTAGTTSDSKQWISATSTIIIMDGGGNTAVCSTTLLGKAAITTMDADGFTLNWSIASTSPNIIRYYAIGGSDITYATTGTLSLGSGSAGNNSVTTGFAPDFVFYLSGDTATVDSAVADANMGVGFATAATSTQQAESSFAVNDAAATGANRSTQTTASSTAILGSAVTTHDMHFRTMSLNSNGFTVRVDKAPAANVSVFYLALKGGQHFVAATTSPTTTGAKSTTRLGFQPEGMVAMTHGLAASNTIQNNVGFSFGSVGWSTTTGVSATTSTGMVALVEVTADANPSNYYDTRSTNSIVKGYAPIATDNRSPTVSFDVTPTSFDINGFTWNYTSATTTARQILYWAIGPSPTVSGNVYSDEGITGLANSRTIKAVVYDGTATTTYSTTTVASTGKFDFFNLSYGRGDKITFYLSGATEKAVLVYEASSSQVTSLSGLKLYQNNVILRTATSSDTIALTDLAGADSNNDTDIQFAESSGNLSLTSGIHLYTWASTTLSAAGTVTTQGAGNLIVATSSTVTLSGSGNTIGGDIVVASGSQLTIAGNTTVNGGDVTTVFNSILTYSGTPTLTISGTGSIGGGNGTTTFYNLTTSGTGNTTLSTTTVVQNNLVVGSGTTLLGTKNVFVNGGSATGDGTINFTGGTFRLDGTGSFGGATGWTFNNLTFGDGTTLTVSSSTGAGSITVTASTTVAINHVLDAGQKTWNFNATGTVFTLSGGLVASTSTFSFKGTTGTTTVPNLSYYNLDFSPTSGNPVYKFAEENSSYVLTTTTPVALYGLGFDSTNAAVYAAGANKIYKCVASSGCASPNSWIIATTTPNLNGIVIFDSTNSVLYAGDSVGIIYKCIASTGCASTGNWTLATTTSDPINDLIFDSTNSAVYSGDSNGQILKCVASTGCASVGNWTLATSTPTAINTLTFDSVNSAVYAGDSAGKIFKCVASTGCTSAGNWTLATATPAVFINALTFDSVNSAVYAGDGNGRIYKCLTSTGCTSTGNWVVATTTVISIYTLSFGASNAAVYAGDSAGRVYKCLTSTGCTSTGNWNLVVNTGAAINALTFDSVNGVSYVGDNNGNIYRKNNETRSVSATNNLTLNGVGNETVDAFANSALVTAGNLTIGSGDTFLSAPATTTITSSFTNSGTFTNSTGTVLFNGTTSTINGTTTFYNLVLSSSTTTLTSAGTATMTVANILSVTSGDVFDAGTGNVIFTATGTPFSVSGTFVASTSLISFKGTIGTTTIPVLTYYNLDISPQSGSPVFLFSSTGVGGSVTNTGLLPPSATGETFNQWGTPANAYASDNSSAAMDNTSLAQDYYNFNFNIPAGSTINSIDVKVEAAGSSGGDGVIVFTELSWNGGSTYTTTNNNTIATLTLTDTVYTMAAGSSTWGRTWNASELSNSNFRLKIIGGGGGNYDSGSVDQAVVRVFYTPASASTTINNNLSIGGAGSAKVDAYTNNPAIIVGSDLTIGSGATFNAATSSPLVISGDFTNNGTFTHNSGTVVFAPTSTSTITSSASMTFNNISITSPGKELRFQSQSGNLPIFTVAGTFTSSGTLSSPVFLNSNSSGTQWLVHFNSAQSSITYTRIKDSGCDAGSASLSDSTLDTNVSNNGSCWFVVTAAAVYSSGGGATAENGANPDGGGTLTTGGGSGGGGDGGGGGGGSGQGGGGGGGGGGGSGQGGGGGGGGGGASP